MARRTGPPQPMQPIVMVKKIARFKVNKIVRHLLERGGINMNTLAVMDFTNEDRAQFAQLIGYSVSGWGSLRYVTRAQADEADIVVDRLISPKRGLRYPTPSTL